MNMAVIIVALLFFTIHGVEAEARDWYDVLTVTPERVVGLLDLDDIIRGGCGEPIERTTARAFSTPSEKGAGVGTLYWQHSTDATCGLMFERAAGDKEEVPTLESGYEVPAAIVFERRGQWFRIRLANGSTWIRRTDPTEFLPYPDLLREKLAHTLQDWNGILRETPNVSGTIAPLTKGWHERLDRQLSVDYLGSRLVGKELWIHIRLLTEGPCGQKLEGMTPVSGWVPAYRPDRSPSAWFSSRGC